MRDTHAASKNVLPRRITGVGGGILHGVVAAVFFCSLAGAVLAVPKALEEPDEERLVCILIGITYGIMIGPILGSFMGAILGFVNRRAHETVRPSMVTASIVGILVGSLLAASLMWHRVDVDKNLGYRNTATDYVVLSVILTVFMGTMGVILFAGLGWSISLGMRSRKHLLLRLLANAGAGAAAGCLCGLCVLVIGFYILEPLIHGYGGW
jgi:hypothetical protein